MWFKKKSQISGYNSNTAYDGTDWRTTGKTHGWTSSQTLPSAADAGNYFYLPALGNYQYDKMINVGFGGHYWTSSALTWSNQDAFLLFFYRGIAYVSFDLRDRGFRVGGFE